MLANVVLVLLALVLIALVLTVLSANKEESSGAVVSAKPRLLHGGASKGLIALVSIATGIVVALGLILVTQTVAWIAAAIGAVAAVSLSLLLGMLVARKLSQLELQLANAIDIMVSTLRAGGGLSDALDGAAGEAQSPLRGFLYELIERIRLGERSEVVLASLEQRIPLESFRLFTFTLAAHWQGGGSLATTLSNVGRAIRDRVDVVRRVRSQAVETQVSVVGVMVVTYGLALLMWQNYPERVQTFAESEIGSMFIGASILLQAIGLFWISNMTKIEV